MRARLVVVLGLVAAACGSTASPNAAARHDILYVDRATDTAVLDADTGAERIALPAGIATADWSHYWSVEPSGDSTAVHAIDATSAATTRTFSVAGRFALPGVYGAAPSGLSANGQWLVLAAAHAPGAGATSRFAVVDLVNARLARTITAAGDYTFDAVSDDGRNVYLIEHLDSATQYRVRVANREGGGVAADPIVDIKVAAPSMNGIFHSAVADPHGQWQFGLYFNPTKGPFIHALNTTQLYAQCILALPDGGAGVRAMWSMVMDAPGGHLYVVNGAAGIVTDVGPTRAVEHAARASGGDDRASTAPRGGALYRRDAPLRRWRDRDPRDPDGGPLAQGTLPRRCRRAEPVAQSGRAAPLRPRGGRRRDAPRGCHRPAARHVRRGPRGRAHARGDALKLRDQRSVTARDMPFTRAG